MDIDYTPQERLANIIDILAEGVLALMGSCPMLLVVEFLKVHDIASIKIMPSDIIFSKVV